MIELPWPPSLNSYYRTVKNRILISAKGREYRKRVSLLIKAEGAETVVGKCKVDIAAFPPDKRKRDLDNLLKCLLDVLQHSGVIQDDGDIDDLRIHRHHAVKGGAVLVKVSRA